MNMQANTSTAQVEQELRTLFSVDAVASPQRQNFILKKSLDFTAALFLLIILTPFLLFIAALIKLTSPGPIVFCQKRVGKRRQIFCMYKFRSMIENADKIRPKLRNLNEAKGHFFKIKNDPRVTKVGKWIRLYSLDELPQLINVLKGEMSLVGPRPMPLDEVESYTDWHHQRHQVIPGLTGLWQVSGRSDLPFDEMIELDLLYIQNHSFRLDLRILLKTISIVLRRKGAY